jgi:hypothetical protein
MEFRRGDVRKCVLLPRRSLVVMAHECRYGWCASSALPWPLFLCDRSVSNVHKHVLLCLALLAACSFPLPRSVEEIPQQGTSMLWAAKESNKTCGPDCCSSAGSTTSHTEERITSTGKWSTENHSACLSRSGRPEGSVVRVPGQTCVTARTALYHQHACCSCSSNSSSKGPASTLPLERAAVVSLCHTVKLFQSLHGNLCMSWCSQSALQRLKGNLLL